MSGRAMLRTTSGGKNTAQSSPDCEPLTGRRSTALPHNVGPLLGVARRGHVSHPFDETRMGGVLESLLAAYV